MGNEVSGFEDCVIDKEIENEGLKDWTLHPAETKEGQKVSVFIQKKKKERRGYTENAIKYLKTLRHPTILKFYTSFKTTDGVHVVTEPVVPLETVIEDLSPEEICAGLYNVVEGLVFLHDRGGLTHNNLHISSVFVAQDGSWKLGGMDFLCKFQEADRDFLEGCKSLRDETIITPEEKAGKVDPDPQYGYARDVFAFGTLAESLLEYLSILGDMTRIFELRIQEEFLNPDPKQRPRMNSLLEDRLFKNEFLEIKKFLKNITLKDEEEKKEFFSTIIDKLHTLPETLVAKRLVEPLLSRFVLLDQSAVEYLVPHILTPKHDEPPPESIKPLLSKKLFQRHVIPVIYKIFHVRDAHVRFILLQYFPQYVSLFTKTDLQLVILPQLLVGLRDTDDRLVELTLHALADLVPLLGGAVVIGENRSKLFAEGKPRSGKLHQTDNIPLPATNVSTVITMNQEPISAEVNVSKNGSTDDEKLRRQQEKERRKEESRMRNEERKRKREERRKLQSVEALASDTDVNRSEIPIPKCGSSEMNEHNQDDSLEKDNPSPYNDEKADWSDWEEMQKSDDSQNLDNSDIDREIENEISKMGPTLSLIYSRTNNDVEKDENILDMDTKEYPPPVKMDWSNVPDDIVKNPEEQKPKGKLKLNVTRDKKHYQNDSQNKSAIDKLTESVNSNTGLDWGDEGWGEAEGTSANDSPRVKSPMVTSPRDTSPRITSPRTTKSKTKQTTNPQQSSNHEVKIAQLGSEFDVLSMEIKKIPKKDEFDFFADMEPEIVKSPKSSLESPGHVTQLSDAQSPEIASSLEKQSPRKPVSFAMLETSDADAGGGWGDEDLAWGEEEEW